LISQKAASERASVETTDTQTHAHKQKPRSAGHTHQYWPGTARTVGGLTAERLLNAAAINSRSIAFTAHINSLHLDDDDDDDVKSLSVSQSVSRVSDVLPVVHEATAK